LGAIFGKDPFHLGAIFGKGPFHLGAIQRQWREIGDLVSSVRLVKPLKPTSKISNCHHRKRDPVNKPKQRPSNLAQQSTRDASALGSTDLTVL
jgi:hypothetical protein